MDYSKMSDFEINCKVARAADLEGMMFFDVDSSFCAGPVWSVPSGISDDGFSVSRGNPFNPCNKPADAWPIILGQKLSLINADDQWLCVPDDTAVEGTTGDEVQIIYSGDGHANSNPLRAAMVVYLMMQEAK